jgi:hypothetical protein
MRDETYKPSHFADEVLRNIDLRGRVAENSQIYAMLVETVAANVNRRSDERWSRFQTTFVSIISILAAVAAVAGGFLINELIQVRIDKGISSAVERYVGLEFGEFEFFARTSSLDGRVAAINASEGFSNSEARSAISDFEYLYTKFASQKALDDGLDPSEHASNRSRLTQPFDILVKNFASADRHDLVFELAEIAPEVSDKSDTVTQLVVQGLGRKLIGTPGGAATWQTEGESNYDLFQNYRRYAQKAEATGFPELFLLFEMILRDMEGRSPPEIIALIERVDDLNAVDRGNFIDVLQDLHDETFINVPNSESTQISNQVKAFLRKYSSNSEMFTQILSDEAL